MVTSPLSPSVAALAEVPKPLIMKVKTGACRAAVVCCAILASCSGQRKTLIRDISDADVPTLIRDNFTFPEHRDYLRYVILNERSYDGASYAELCQYCEAAAPDSDLFAGLSAIKAERETAVMAAIDTMGHSARADYYSAHADERGLLRPLFLSSYVTGLESLPYDEAKDVAARLARTDLGGDVERARLKYRDKVYPYANIFGEDYEREVFAKLEGGDVFSVAEYYRDNVRDRLFLTPILSRALHADDTLSYQEAKILYNEFKGTELGDEILPRYDSLRSELEPFVAAGVDSLFLFEDNIIDTYKAYAYEDAMDGLAEASGNIIVGFLMPTVGDIVGAICADPVSFASDLVSGIVDDVKKAASSVLNWLTGDSDNESEPAEKEVKLSADEMYRNAYRAYVSQARVDSIISAYAAGLADELASARISFANELVGVTDSTLAPPAVPLLPVAPYSGRCDISELRSIISNRDADDNMGDALACASYVPMIGDYISAVDAVYSLSKYQGEVDATKAKLEKFQDKLSDHFTQMVDYYISLRFTPLKEKADSSRVNYKSYVLQNL